MRPWLHDGRLTPSLAAPQRNIADTGLSLLLQICESFEGSDFATQFYQVYYLQLMQEIFAVMTGASLRLRATL